MTERCPDFRYNGDVYGVLDATGAPGFYRSDDFFDNPVSAYWLKVSEPFGGEPYPKVLAGSPGDPFELYMGSGWGILRMDGSGDGSNPAPESGDPIVFEAENLTRADTSRKWVVNIQYGSASGGRFMNYGGSGPRDYIEFDVNVPLAGNYNINIEYFRDPNRGEIQLQVDGINIASPFDCYNSSPGFVTAFLGTVSFLDSGNYTFRFLTNSKNASSSSYRIGVDKISLLPVSSARSDFEIEDLPLAGTSGKWVVKVQYGSASGGRFINYGGDELGDYIQFNVSVPAAGAYSVNVDYFQDRNRGKIQLQVDGVNIASAFDCYNASPGFTTAFLGPVSFSEAGDYTFRFFTNSKNVNSTSYRIGIDAISLIPD